MIYYGPACIYYVHIKPGHGGSGRCRGPRSRPTGATVTGTLASGIPTSSMYVPCSYRYVPVCTGMYHAMVWYLYKQTVTDIMKPVCTVTWFIQFTPGMYLVHTFYLKYVPVCTSMYQYILGIKCMFSGTLAYFRQKVCTQYILQESG